MPAARVSVPGTQLTSREREVLELVRQRLTNTEIAEQLYLSVRTVETHVSALLRKMGVDDRRALGELAARHGARAARATLPVPLTAFVGRRAELEQLVEAVRANRLVVTAGPGGAGKTRLALEAAHALAPDFSDGCIFVDLVKVSEPSMVMGVVADACDAPERAGATREATLIATLADRECLMIVDNCEHVQDAARTVIERLLVGCSSLRVLATSRLRLMLPFERVIAIGGLSLDAPDGRSDAATLFVDRMTAAGGLPPTDQAELVVVGQICTALDGMALAIELAAARAPSLGLAGLAAALSERLPILTIGSRSDDRHRSLRAAIDWSYDLLEAPVQEALRATAVFAGAFDANALSEVVGRPLPLVLQRLANLVDWNLVSLDTSSPGRHRLLETIRQYVVDLDAFEAEEPTLRANHLAWCEHRITDLLEHTTGDEWYADADAVLVEARAALAHHIAVPTNGDDGARFAGLWGDLAFQRGSPGEAQRCYQLAAERVAAGMERGAWLRLAAGAASARNVGADTVDLLLQSAQLAVEAGQPDQAATDFAAAAALQLRADGIIDRVVTLDQVSEHLGAARTASAGGARAEAAIAVAEGWTLGSTAHSRQTTLRAVQLAEAAADPLLIDEALDQLAALQLGEGDLFGAADTISRRLEVLAKVPIDAASGFEHYDALHMACQVNLALGRLEPARQYADRITSLAFLREERHLGFGRRLGVDAMAGEFEVAVEHAALFEQDWRRAGKPVAGNLAVGAYAAAMTFGMLDDEATRERWVEITRGLLADPNRLDAATNIWKMLFDGMLALHRAAPDQALELLVVTPTAESFGTSANHPLWLSWYAAAWSEAAVLTGGPDALERISTARKVAAANEIALAIVERAAAIQDRRVEELATIARRLTALGAVYQAERTLLLATRA